MESVTDAAVGFPDGNLAARRSGFRSQSEQESAVELQQG